MPHNIQKYEHHYCITCGKTVTFNSLSKGYRRFCGNGGCVYKSNEFKTISKSTCQEKYGVDYASQSPEFRISVIKTVKEKYGVDNISKSPIIQQTKKDTCIEKYGVDHYSKTEEWKNRCEDTSMDRYGVPHYTNRPLAKQTSIERYGVENYTNVSYGEFLTCKKCGKIQGHRFKDSEEGRKVIEKQFLWNIKEMLCNECNIKKQENK